MNDVVGVELGIDVARAVACGTFGSRPVRTFESNWDATRPAELVTALRRHFGPTRRIALSVGLGFLHVKHVRLPPAPARERVRMLALEPDRYFPVQHQPLVVSLVSETDFAFAIDADVLARWIAAFEEWAPIENVEPAPVSLARALGKSAQGTFALPAGADEQGRVELGGRELHSARRIPSGAPAAAVEPLPARAGVSSELLCALGAARGVTSAIDTMLVPDALAIRLRRRRRQRVARAAIVCLAAFAAATWSVDRSRVRMLQRIEREIAALSPQAVQAVQLRDALAAGQREAEAIDELAARRQDPLNVLAALSAQLPAGATVLNLRAVGADWQIDGTAQDAAAIVTVLARNEQFQDVRFLSASSRFRERDRIYETFSIAFRVRPDA